jgi:hypothetical protein
MGYFGADVRLLQEQERARSGGFVAGIAEPGSGNSKEAQSQVKGLNYVEYRFGAENMKINRRMEV